MNPWKALPPGETVLLHSSARRLLQSTGLTPDELLTTLIKHLRGGTLLMPLFNFGFCNGEPFHWFETPSKTGALTEAARLHPEAVLSGHPVYRFAAIGPDAHLFAVDNRDAFGIGSPFAILERRGGIIAVLDLDDQRSMTAYHYAEAQHLAPWRISKTFTGRYTDDKLVTTVRTYEIRVRHLDYETRVNPAGMALWERGIWRGKKPDDKPGLRFCEMVDFVDAVGVMVKEQPELLRERRNV